MANAATFKVKEDRAAVGAKGAVVRARITRRHRRPSRVSESAVNLECSGRGITADGDERIENAAGRGEF